MNNTQEKHKQGFLAKLKYAFSVEKEENFSEEEMELLGKIADAVVKRKLAIPAIMFLESIRPLNFIGSQAMAFFQPILGAVSSTIKFEKAGELLEKRKSVAILIDILERKNQELEMNKK